MFHFGGHWSNRVASWIFPNLHRIKMKTKIFLAIFLICLSILAGCNQTEVTQEVQDAEVAENASYPVPPTPNRDNSAYPYPEPVENQAQATLPPFSPPIPSEGKGIVIGQVIDENSGEPLVYYTVVLGELIPLEPGPAYTIGVHERSSPRAFSDGEGRFGIGDVPPGTYALLIWTPFEATIVQDPETDSDMLVEVAAGQSLDLGTIMTSAPTTPGE